MPIPEDIVFIKARKSGRYAIFLDLNFEALVVVEVDERGCVYQLTQDNVRDGILSDHGWTRDVKAYTFNEGMTEFTRIALPV